MFQDIAFYHTTDKQGAFAITLDRTTPANTQTQLVSKKKPSQPPLPQTFHRNRDPWPEIKFT